MRWVTLHRHNLVPRKQELPRVLPLLLEEPFAYWENPKDSAAGNVSVPATVYNIGPSREQLLAEMLRQLFGSADAHGGN